jgi:hypothetical protein
VAGWGVSERGGGEGSGVNQGSPLFTREQVTEGSSGRENSHENESADITAEK